MPHPSGRLTIFLSSQSNPSRIRSRKQAICAKLYVIGHYAAERYVTLEKNEPQLTSGPASPHEKVGIGITPMPSQHGALSSPIAGIEATSDGIEVLTDLLKVTSTDLQNIIADFEQPNEALKADGRNQISADEEFRPTDDGLNEKLESLNNELMNRNAQLQQRVEGERLVSNELDNLLKSSDIAILLLDRNLVIKRFTHPITRIFNLISSDVGRSLNDIPRNIEDPELVKDAESVLADLAPRQREIKGNTEDRYIRRILPYRTQENKVDGVVITFLDISRLKISETQAKAAQAFAANIINTSHRSVIVLDRDLRIQAANPSFYKAFQIKPENAPGQLIFDLEGGLWDISELRELLSRVIPDRVTVENFEIEHNSPQLGHRIMLLNARRIRSSDEPDGLCLVSIEDITQRRAAEQALLEREAYLKAVLATAPDGIITIDERGIVKSFSPAAERLFGFSESEIIGNNVSQYLKTGEPKIARKREVIGLRKDGTELPLRLSMAETKLPGHRLFVGILHDLTEMKQRTEEHLQAQKMEALGQLAGGIAHDFNNLLTIIIGNIERMQAGTEESELRTLLSQNYNAAERGRSLTKRLLSFAHRSRLEPTTLCLNDRVLNMTDMLHRTIGEGITITSAMEPDLWNVRADPGEMDHALLNLVLNARDAMHSGGNITIETANETFASGEGPVDLLPGGYVRLSVIDTGIGMTPDVLKRAVDPFFTTKPRGKGTGLGLPSAYGFAGQSGGCLVITSEAGKGTTVSLYLPRTSGDLALSAMSVDGASIPLGDGELVLVVDDDDEVREVTLKRLESLGYAVIEAANGPKALERCAGEPVALALVDVVMPGGLSGYEVADRLRKLAPDIKILLTTGYDGADRKSTPEPTGNFKVLAKPCTRAELALAVAETLAS